MISAVLGRKLAIFSQYLNLRFISHGGFNLPISGSTLLLSDIMWAYPQVRPVALPCSVLKSDTCTNTFICDTDSDVTLSSG